MADSHSIVDIAEIGLLHASFVDIFHRLACVEQPSDIWDNLSVGCVYVCGVEGCLGLSHDNLSHLTENGSGCIHSLHYIVFTFL